MCVCVYLRVCVSSCVFLVCVPVCVVHCIQQFPNPPCLQVDRHARQTSMVLVRAGEGQRFESRQSNDVEDIKVPAGEAVDIFYRYGTWLLLLLSTSSTDTVGCNC